MTFTEYGTPGIKVQAEQVEDEPRSVITPNGAITAQPGDWEVRYEDGNVKAMTDDEFQEEFGDSGSPPDEETDEKESSTAVQREDTIGEDEKAETESETHKPAPPPPATRRR